MVQSYGSLILRFDPITLASFCCMSLVDFMVTDKKNLDNIDNTKYMYIYNKITLNL